MVNSVLPSMSRGALLATASVAALAVVLTASGARSEAVWNGTAQNNNYFDPGNWTLVGGGAVPPTDKAIFNGGYTNVYMNGDWRPKIIGELHFSGGARFKIESAVGSDIRLNARGITTDGSGINPILVNNELWAFSNSASADHAEIINTYNSDFVFEDNSTAAHATIKNEGGYLIFQDNSTAASAAIVNATDHASLEFNQQSTAGSATIHNEGHISFREDATAGNAIILNQKDVSFRDDSSAANATITTTASGEISFGERAQGGNARLITHAGGVVHLQYSLLDSLSFRSIEGAGEYRLGSKTLIVNSTTKDEVSGVVSGTSGSLVKRGAGTLILSGVNTYTGQTAVEGGSLIVNGSTASSAETIVTAGGTLGGTGTVGALSVQGGIVAPGHNGIGTLSVQGNVQFGPGSVFQVQVNPAGQNDKLVSSGAATLNGGTVAVQAQSGTYAPSTTYTILTANNGVSGRFDQLTSDFAFLTPTLNYTTNEVQLVLTRNSTPLDDVATNPNQGGAGQGVVGTGNNPLTRALLGLTRSEAQQTLAQLSGEIYATAQGMVAYQDELVRRALLARMMSFSTPALPPGLAAVSQSSVAYAADLAPRSAPVATPVAVAPGLGIETWGQVFGSWGNTEGSANHAGLDRSTGGFLVGADAGLAGAWRAGLAGGYSRTLFDMPGVLSSGAVESVHVAAYGAGSLGAVQLRAGAAYTHSDIDVSRSVAFRGFSDALTGSFDSRSAVVFGEVGYRFGFGGVSLEPFAGLSHLHVSSDAYVEEGGLAALTGQGRDFAVTASTLGLRAALTPVGSGAVSAKGMLGWRHGFGDLVPVTVHRFVAGDTPFAVSGAPLDRDALVVEAGLDWAVTPDLTLAVKYDGQIGQRDQEHALRGQAVLRF